MTQAKFKIKKGDEVVILTGRDKGKKGEVLKVITEKSRVVVQGVNVVTKHEKPSQVSAGGIQKKELSIHVSNVAVADPKSGEPTRVGYKTLKDGKKVRIARKSGEEIGVAAPVKEKAKKAAPKKEAKAKDAPKKEESKAKKETKAKDTAKKEK